jgi:serine/threonine protein kinase
MAPEILSGSEYDYLVDWWSFGILAYQLLCRKMPYSDENRNQLFWKIQNVSPRFPEELDKSCIDFLSCFLAKDPKQRSTFESSRFHAFWKDLDFDQVLDKQYIPEFAPEKSHSIEEDCKNYFFQLDNENIELEKYNQIFQIFDHFSFISDSY